jgi:apolipoprotein D and lipocalin family protein
MKIKSIIPMKRILILILIMFTFKSFSQTKPSVVQSVDLKKYSGLWYEIARLPNPFEKNLKCITAEYTLREDGKITVLNGGHSISDPSEKRSSKGVAWIPDKKVPAKLKVQFFWPFSGNYWIIYLEKDYKYVLVGDPSFKYLWILSREKVMDDATYKMLLDKAKSEGFDVKPIIRVDHDCN